MTRIIGLGHYSRTGKDTFANALIDALRERHPRIKVGKKSFATKLKDVTHQLYGWAGLMDEDYYNDPEHEHERTVVLPELDMTPVDVWVKFGTLAVREQVYDPTWVDYVLETDSGLDIMIIPDVRFLNEIEALRAKDAHLIKIVRPGYGPRMTVADLALIHYTGWDNVIGDHRGTDGMALLREWADRYARVLLEQAPWTLVDRGPNEIEEALAIQNLPTDAEIIKVFADAGLDYEDYRAA
jgi:hypothetical protein